MTKQEEFEWALGVIRNNEKHGIVTIRTKGGLLSCPLDRITEQFVEDLLCDLDRDKETALVLGEEGNERWVNDYAVALVIEYLMNEVKRLKNGYRKRS